MQSGECQQFTIKKSLIEIHNWDSFKMGKKVERTAFGQCFSHVLSSFQIQFLSNSSFCLPWQT